MKHPYVFILMAHRNPLTDTVFNLFTKEIREGIFDS